MNNRLPICACIQKQLLSGFKIFDPLIYSCTSKFSHPHSGIRAGCGGGFALFQYCNLVTVYTSPVLSRTRQGGLLSMMMSLFCVPPHWVMLLKVVSIIEPKSVEIVLKD